MTRDLTQALLADPMGCAAPHRIGAEDRGMALVMRQRVNHITVASRHLS